MKAILMVISLTALFLAFPSVASSDSAKRSNRGRLAQPLWVSNATVKVHFVQNLFTPAQREVLWQELVAWSRIHNESNVGARMPGVMFFDAGQTGGLIDCVACLTITRHQVLTNDPSHRASFNYLRRDHTGRLVSAWIGLDSGAKDPRVLRQLIHKALEQGLNVNPPRC